VNTAYALAQQNPNSEVLIVDMVFPMGTVGQSLGFEAHNTVVKLTRSPQIDRAAVEKFVSARTRWGFRILIGANDPQEATDLVVNQITPLFEVLKTMYDYILVDFGRALSRISLPIIEISERVAIILTPDISTVKGTRLIMQYLNSLDISLDHMFVINNRTVGRVWTTADDIEREIGTSLGTTIPFTVEYMTMAINAAVPFMERFPDNSASASFTDIAQRLQGRVKAI
jgi:pilus assembly protein CpaE